MSKLYLTFFSDRGQTLVWLTVSLSEEHYTLHHSANACNIGEKIGGPFSFPLGTFFCFSNIFFTPLNLVCKKYLIGDMLQ